MDLLDFNGRKKFFKNIQTVFSKAVKSIKISTKLIFLKLLFLFRNTKNFFIGTVECKKHSRRVFQRSRRNYGLQNTHKWKIQFRTIRFGAKSYRLVTSKVAF